MPSSPHAESGPSYVSRGGLKLRGALDAFQIDVQGLTALDIGSSHGGFTDCLLQAGAAAVWCVDVGKGLLDYKLRKDPRVHLLEEQNIRWLEPGRITASPDLITIDVSFISLAKVLPKVIQLMRPDTRVLAMVKPQFEGTPKEAPGGFVRDETTRQAILARVRESIGAAGFTVHAVADSTVKGRQGNQETFFYLMRTP